MPRSKRKKTKVRLAEISDEDIYLSSVEARMTRLALRLDRRRRRWYVV